jgi:hypothetical protein
MGFLLTIPKKTKNKKTKKQTSKKKKKNSPHLVYFHPDSIKKYRSPTILSKDAAGSRTDQDQMMSVGGEVVVNSLILPLCSCLCNG